VHYTLFAPMLFCAEADYKVLVPVV